MIYHLALLTWVTLLLPRVFYQAIVHKKYRGSLLSRIGLFLPKMRKKEKGEFRIWIHAVSLGETKAAAPLIDEIKKEYPKAVLFFSSATETGEKVARKYPLEAFFFLPIDFSWIMNRLVQEIEPDLFILMESDYWINLLTALKDGGTTVVVVNGKISETSYKRFSWIPSFAQKLFGSIDFFCLQSEEYKIRFQHLGVPEERLHVTGNVKFDIQSTSQPAHNLHFPKEGSIVTLASTHENEEEMLIKELNDLEESIALLIAPRHPERFSLVRTLLEKNGIPYRTISEEDKGEKFVLVDQMGVLDPCYLKSKAVIMGGSFVSHVGGHNIYEPLRLGTPVIYGPHMHGQKNIVAALEKHNLGRKTPLEFLKKELLEALHEGCSEENLAALKKEMEGASKRSWRQIKTILAKKIV